MRVGVASHICLIGKIGWIGQLNTATLVVNILLYAHFVAQVLVVHFVVESVFHDLESGASLYQKVING